MRQFAGYRPAWAIALTARAAEKKSANCTAPQGRGMRLELRLECRAEDAGLDARGARDAVDFDDAVQMTQVQRDCRAAHGAFDRRFDAADDRAAGAERYQCGLCAGRPIGDRG